MLVTLLTSCCPSQTGLLSIRGPPPRDASPGPPGPRPSPQGVLTLPRLLTRLGLVGCHPLLTHTPPLTPTPPLTLTPPLTRQLTLTPPLTRLDMVGRSPLRPGCLWWTGGGTGARSSGRAGGTWTEGGVQTGGTWTEAGVQT